MKTTLEPEDIQSIVGGVIAGLKPLLIQREVRPEDTIFDVPALSKYLHVTPKWIHERTHLKQIPYYKLSNKQLRWYCQPNCVNFL